MLRFKQRHRRVMYKTYEGHGLLQDFDSKWSLSAMYGGKSTGMCHEFGTFLEAWTFSRKHPQFEMYIVGCVQEVGWIAPLYTGFDCEMIRDGLDQDGDKEDEHNSQGE